jgi:Spy/CpxP family protein refolding chaperone
VKNLKLWLGLLALFLSGVCVGGLGTWMIAEQRLVSSFAQERPPFHSFIVRKLARELGLNEVQRREIEKIVYRTEEELRDLSERTRPERDEIMRRSREAMKVGLSPEQQTRLEELHGRMEARRRHRERRSHSENGS